MIITKTPFRISFVGGGSDLEAFYKNHPGAVLSTSINQYMYISSHKYFEPDQIRVKYSQTETVSQIADLKHPILKVVLEKFGLNGIEISSIADIPGGTGMGSSSSFTVGLLHNLYAATGKKISKAELAEEACNIEINLLKEPIGKQDQYAAAFGGMNVLRFANDGTTTVEMVDLSTAAIEQLESNLLMFYMGSQRKASDILTEQQKNTSQEDKFEILKKMVDLVYDLQNALEAGHLSDMGKILHENWILKQQLASGISNPDINECYETALKNGALGGKLLGAGGGGFMLFYCAQDKQAQLTNALSKLRRFKFGFETGGSNVIYSDKSNG
jgi:D-glycero-alpha-D-manno-heptose-7-phosphate kinase